MKSADEYLMIMFHAFMDIAKPVLVLVVAWAGLYFIIAGGHNMMSMGSLG